MIVTETDASVDGVLLTAQLAYDLNDPLAIRYQVDETVWFIGRDLFSEALGNPYIMLGDGDVKIESEPDLDQLHVTLHGRDGGTALIDQSLGVVASFIRRTFALVPFGCEGDRIDWNAELAGLGVA